MISARRKTQRRCSESKRTHANEFSDKTMKYRIYIFYYKTLCVTQQHSIVLTRDENVLPHSDSVAIELVIILLQYYECFLIVF